MEKKPCLAIFDTDHTPNLARSVRDVPPAHYIMKIESYSLLSMLLKQSGDDKYESNEFEAGGYSWRLVLYPNGNKKRDVNDHISINLAMSNAEKLTIGSEVNVIFKFFVFDQIREKYLSVEDVSSFNALMTVRGITRVLSLTTLNDPLNGYLIDDCCIFGAEVFVLECQRKGESLTMKNEPANATFTWKIDKFSELTDDSLYSEVFTVDDSEWRLRLYPCGDTWAKGKSVSVFLTPHDNSVLRTGWKVYADYTIIIKDQVLGKHNEIKDRDWFHSGSGGWGIDDLVSLSDLKDKRKGFIVNDTLVVEVKIDFLSVVNRFA